MPGSVRKAELALAEMRQIASKAEGENASTVESGDLLCMCVCVCLFVHLFYGYKNQIG